MCSRLAAPRALLRLLAVLACASFLTACSLKLNDPVTKQVKTVNTGAGCLSQAGDVLDRFTKGNLSEAEHDGFYACLDKALSTFALHADGKHRDFFEPEELGKFLTTYFLKGKTISPALLREITALKRAFIGGSDDKFSRDELRRMIGLLGVVKRSTGMLRPVMPLRVSAYLERGYSSEEFEAALSRLTQAVALIGENIRTEQQPYSFDRLAALIKELRGFLFQGGQVPDDHWTNTMLKVSEVIRPAKVIFVSPPRNEIATADWPKIYRLAPRYYAAWLRSQFYLHNAFTGFSPAGLDRIERLFTEFVSVFDYVIDQHDDKQITSAQLSDLLKTLHAHGMLPCNPDTALAFLKAAFGRLLGGPSASEGFTVNKESLNRFKETMRYGLEGFHAIAALYRIQEGQPEPLSATEIDRTPDEALLRATRQQSRLSLEAVQAVKRSPHEVRTVFAGSGYKVHIPRHGETVPITHFHLLKVHGLRSLNRLLMQAYGQPGSKSLSEEELNRFLDDIFPVLKELGFVDDALRGSVKNRLQEASLFLYSSDGAGSLNEAEAIELQSLLISTVMHAPQVHASVARACGLEVKYAVDQNGKKRPLKPHVPAACYETEFLIGAARHWDYIPGLAGYFASRPAEEQRGLFATMARFLRKGKTEADDFTEADSQSYVLLPYYIELLFSRFDRNGDGLLNNAEAEEAYPVFQPFLAKKAKEKGINDPKTHKAIFNFLLAYRQLPDDDKIAFVLRRYLWGPASFQVDRGQVVDIFSKLLSL